MNVALPLITKWYIQVVYHTPKKNARWSLSIKRSSYTSEHNPPTVKMYKINLTTIKQTQQICLFSSVTFSWLLPLINDINAALLDSLPPLCYYDSVDKIALLLQFQLITTAKFLFCDLLELLMIRDTCKLEELTQISSKEVCAVHTVLLSTGLTEK